MKLVDTHCHIQSVGITDLGEASTRELWAKAKNLTVEQIISDANTSGVTKMICVGCNLEDSRLAVKFVASKDNCFASTGIHPHEARLYKNQSKLIDEFKKLAKSDKVVAIGECGLDYYYEHSNKDDQIEIFKIQIKLAINLGLPLIFHVRNGFDDFWPIIDAFSGVRGVLHSFTDSKTNVELALKHNFYIGVNGIATFTNDPDQLEVYKTIPLSNLLIETDSPFLTPKPYRGTINQPKYVFTVAKFLAELRGENIEELARATSANANALFGI